MSALKRLVPGGLLLLAATAFLQVAALREPVWALLPAVPYAVFGAGIFLAWRFDRSRLVFALLVLALAERALFYFAIGDAEATEAGRLVFSAVALLLPLNLALLSWISERGFWSPRGRATLGLLLAQLLAIILLRRPGFAEVAAWLEHTFVEAPALTLIGLPQPALLAFGCAFVLATFRFVRRPSAIECGSLWALVGAFLALTADVGGMASSVYLTTGGFIVTVSLIETSYRMAYADELTGLPGRRALNEALEKLGSRYAIAMVDIDHFKWFNDEHGHDVGDQLLRMVASRLAKIGGGGHPFRYGGEEFSVFFPGKSAAEAIPHLEELRKTIETAAFTVRGRRRPRKAPQRPRASAGRRKAFVTVSIGVAEVERRHSTPKQVVEAADAALYRAKQAGRNRVVK